MTSFFYRQRKKKKNWLQRTRKTKSHTKQARTYFSDGPISFAQTKYHRRTRQRRLTTPHHHRYYILIFISLLHIFIQGYTHTTTDSVHAAPLLGSVDRRQLRRASDCLPPPCPSYMFGLILSRDASFCPRDASHCDQYETQMLWISWVTRASVSASTHRWRKRSCLAGSKDRYLSPACLKLFSLSIMHFSRQPDRTRGGIGYFSA